MAGHDTGFHDHDGSEAAIAVLEGQVIEERLGLGGVAHGRYRSGDELTVPPSAIHRVRHAGRAPATTVHAYSPPLRRMGRYSVAANGLLERHPAPAGAALEPVEAAQRLAATA
jgi:quercetin dioxygenase-like cupin family protein